MAAIIHLFILTSLLLIYSINSKMTREECTRSRDTMDLCASQLLFLGDYGQNFAENVQQLESGRCRLINQSINCVDSYADNCMKKFSKTFIKSIVLKTSNIAWRRCSTGSTNLIQMGSCLNEKLNLIHECMETFVTHLESIRDNIQNKQLLIPYTCCRLEDLKKCVLIPSRTCGSNVEQLFNELLDPLKDTICPLKWNDLYKCPNLESLEPKSSDMNDKALSPIVPLIDILNILAPIASCQIARQKVDDCSTRLLVFGDREQKFASTVAQLDKHSCPLLNSSIECLISYGDKCLKTTSPFMNQILSSLINGAKQQYSNRCVNHNRYISLNASICLNEALDSMHLCYDKYVAELETIHFENDDRELRLIYTCCRFHAMKQCTINRVRERCDNKEAVNYLIKLIDNTSKHFLLTTCTDHWEGSAHCQALDPVDTNQVKEKNGFVSYAQSFVRPLIDMFAIHSDQ